MGSFLCAAVLYLVVITTLTLLLFAPTRLEVNVDLHDRAGSRTPSDVFAHDILPREVVDQEIFYDAENVTMDNISDFDYSDIDELFFNDTWNSFDEESYFSKLQENSKEENTPISRKSQRWPTMTFKIGLYHLYHTGLKFQAKKIKMNLCDYKNCKISLLKKTGSKPLNADALVIQGNNVPYVLPARRDPNQVFVFACVESPQHLKVTDLSNYKYRNLFNWTMSYRIDSDIFYPYGQVISTKLDPETAIKTHAYFNSFNATSKLYFTHEEYVNPPGKSGKDYEDLYDRKFRTAAWIVSNCDTGSKREVYVSRMRGLLAIDVMGDCSGVPCLRRDPGCEKRIVREHKFYLAFENSLCRDYVTEKVFKWFRRDIILVVRGATDYTAHLPPGTYVDASDFASPEDLARHLIYLAADRQEYIRMLKRKDGFLTTSHVVNAQAAYCQLCRMLNHVDTYRKSVLDIDAWWTKDACMQPTVE